VPAFLKALADNGAEFPEPFVANLLRLIQKLGPGAGVYKGTSLPPNTAVTMSSGEIALDDEDGDGGFVAPVAQQQQKAPEAPRRAASISPVRYKGEDGIRLSGGEQQQPASNSSSSAAGRKRSRSRSRSRDRYGRRRSPSPRRDGGGRGGDRDRDDRRGRSPPRQRGGGVDPEPVINKIYDGKITGVRDFGAFVALEGIQGRREGAKPSK